MSIHISTNRRQEIALDRAIRTAKTKPGMTLPNGAVLLAQKKRREQPHGHEFTVLAVSPGYQPFVVWTRMIGTQQLSDRVNYGGIDYCFDGDYHRDLADALAAYEKS